MTLLALIMAHVHLEAWYIWLWNGWRFGPFVAFDQAVRFAYWTLHIATGYCLGYYDRLGHAHYFNCY